MAGEVLQPIEIVIPVRKDITTAQNPATGTMWVSGGMLHWVSGNKICRLTIMAGGVTGQSLS